MKARSSSSSLSITNIFLFIGVILITLGVLWTLASNWHVIPAFLKIIILLGATFSVFILGVKLRERRYEKIAQGVFLLAALLWTLSVFLIAQIYNVGVSFQENANLALLSLVGVVVSAYVLGVSSILVVGIWEFVAWVYLQTFANIEFLSFEGEQISSLLHATELGTIAFLFGLGLLHRAFNNLRFARVYTWWASLEFLVLSFWLTNQMGQYFYSIFDAQLSSLVLRLLIPLIVLIAGVWFVLKNNKISKFDAWSGIGVWFVYFIVLSLFPYIFGRTISNYGSFSGSFWSLPPSILVQWIVLNVLFLVVVLLLLTFASKENRTPLVYLGLLAFIIYIIARYIGFMIDLSGYLALSALLVIGGILLIGLAFLFEKVRKTTLKRLR